MSRTVQLLVFFVAVAWALDEDEVRVVGGEAAKPGQFPYQASLRTADKMRHFCGGSVLSPRWIVTAAHCIQRTSPADVRVVTGTVTLDAGGDIYSLEEIIGHEKYDGSETVNDIALLRTNGSVRFDEFTAPIKLWTEPLGSNEDAVLSGWGQTSHPGRPPNNLMFINLKTLDNSNCRIRHIIRPITDGNVCTLTRVGQGACMGDSGGPLAHKNRLMAIVSWGTPCARGMPDVFTRVSSYVNWIQEHTNGEVDVKY